ncbi:MAG: SURF1 family protein [Pseudomonadota bacterium]
MTARTQRRPPWVRAIAFLIVACTVTTLVGLGTWQLRRLEWKRELIAAVEARAYEPAVEAPVGSVTRDEDAYRRVRVTGRFHHDQSRRVKALTALGSGFWLMVPLETERDTVWINRGFVPSGTGAEAWYRPQGLLHVEGLLRVTEPGGTLLEKNDPPASRWYSRDVAALARDAGVEQARPYFIDADHSGPPSGFPRGGLTQLSFRNTHLAYALTWYAMAALLLGASFFVRFRAEESEP